MPRDVIYLNTVVERIKRTRELLPVEEYTIDYIFYGRPQLTKLNLDQLKELKETLKNGAREWVYNKELNPTRSPFEHSGVGSAWKKFMYDVQQQIKKVESEPKTPEEPVEDDDDIFKEELEPIKEELEPIDEEVSDNVETLIFLMKENAKAIKDSLVNMDLSALIEEIDTLNEDTREDVNQMLEELANELKEKVSIEPKEEKPEEPKEEKPEEPKEEKPEETRKLKEPVGEISAERFRTELPLIGNMNDQDYNHFKNDINIFLKAKQQPNYIKKGKVNLTQATETWIHRTHDHGQGKIGEMIKSADLLVNAVKGEPEKGKKFEPFTLEYIMFLKEFFNVGNRNTSQQRKLNTLRNVLLDIK